MKHAKHKKNMGDHSEENMEERMKMMGGKPMMKEKGHASKGHKGKGR